MSGALARPEAPLEAAGFAALANAGPAQMADLEAFRAMLADWNGRMNLVGPATLAHFWRRHAWDSAQLLMQAPQARDWADLGAGAGFPGLVLAILLKGMPGARVRLVESVSKKCRFLGAVADAVVAPAEVIHARAESVALQADVVTARACAPLARLLGYAAPSLRRGGIGLFLKGQDAEAEIAEARRHWRFDVEVRQSLSDSRGRILRIERLARAS